MKAAPHLYPYLEIECDKSLSSRTQLNLSYVYLIYALWLTLLPANEPDPYDDPAIVVIVILFPVASNEVNLELCKPEKQAIDA